ncbi:MAG: helix-turn-helix domain-containing protein [Ignavibacteria bacterium]|nr:helix-turn-helix domain-containing protein [Ignavibacteria bacterium]
MPVTNKVKKQLPLRDNRINLSKRKISISNTENSKEFELFNPGIFIKEARKSRNMTQLELAEKTGTTKSHISRMENNISDIRLSTLKKIIQVGLNGKLKLSIEF